jgi:hypothetical protein
MPLGFQQDGLDGIELSLYGDVRGQPCMERQAKLTRYPDLVLFSTDIRLFLLDRNAVLPCES